MPSPAVSRCSRRPLPGQREVLLRAGAPVEQGKAQSQRHARPKVAVDTVLFGIEAGRLKSYLVQLKRGPNRGRWAFPGRLVQVGELLDDAARHELESATALSDPYLEQLFSFGDPTRDPKAHVVSVAYMALTGEPAKVTAASSRYSAGRWFEAGNLPELAYDHVVIAAYALKRLKAKLEYTNIACNLLPPSFSFAELEELYGLVLGRGLDRRNFRRRILAMGLLRRLPQKRLGAHRPATLYEFFPHSLRTIEML